MDAFDDYLDIIRGQDKTDGTIKQYDRGLELFGEWLVDQSLEPAAVTTRDLQRYLSWLKGTRGYAPKTIRGYFSAVSGFYSDLKSAGEIDADPTEDIDLKKYAPKETMKERQTRERRVWLTKDQMGQLVENVPKPVVRNRLVVLFQYYTGLRRDEVVSVRLDDLDREQRQVRVRGKNNTIHTAHWQPKLDGLLQTWLDGGYRAASPYAGDSPYLFLTESSPQMNGGVVNDIVVQAAENAGIQETLYTDAAGNDHNKYTSHALRHSFAMHWLENGGSIEGLSKHLAHQSVTTTEIYGEILEERASEEYEQFAPDIDFEL